MSVRGMMDTPAGTAMFDPRRVNRRARKAAIMEANARLAQKLKDAERSKQALAGLIDAANKRAAHATSLWGRVKALFAWKVW